MGEVVGRFAAHDGLRHSEVSYLYVFQRATPVSLRIRPQRSIFEYSNLRLSADSVTAAGEVVASMDIKNTGTRAGDEVVQLYVKHLNSAVERPINELRGFKHITL